MIIEGLGFKKEDDKCGRNIFRDYRLFRLIKKIQTVLTEN